MTWQTEFDKKIGNKWKAKNEYLPSTKTVNEIRAFIQDLLDRKAREIKGLKKPIMFSLSGASSPESIKSDRRQILDFTDGLIFNTALDQALSILKDNHES